MALHKAAEGEAVEATEVQGGVQVPLGEATGVQVPCLILSLAT